MTELAASHTNHSLRPHRRSTAAVPCVLALLMLASATAVGASQSATPREAATREAHTPLTAAAAAPPNFTIKPTSGPPGSAYTATLSYHPDSRGCQVLAVTTWDDTTAGDGFSLLQPGGACEEVQNRTYHVFQTQFGRLAAPGRHKVCAHPYAGFPTPDWPDVCRTFTVTAPATPHPKPSPTTTPTSEPTPTDSPSPTPSPTPSIEPTATPDPSPSASVSPAEPAAGGGGLLTVPTVALVGGTGALAAIAWGGVFFVRRRRKRPPDR